MNPIRIGIDGNVFAGPRTGIGVYCQNLICELDKTFPDATFFVYTRHPVQYKPPSSRWINRVEPNALWARTKYQLWLRARCHKLYSQDKISVFWGAATFLPRLIEGVRGISTLYDLTYLIAPATMAYGTYWQHRLWIARDLRRADRVISISAGTAERTSELIGIRGHGVEHPRVLEDFQMSKIPVRALPEVAALRPYFLAVGSQEPRKQLHLLVQAYVALRRQWPNNENKPLPRLLLAGGPGWRNADLVDYIDKHKADDIHSLGFVDTDTLRSLYANALAFIFPSAYEGFGIPVREALMMGAPVYATNTPELREAGGVYAVFFDDKLEILTQLLQQIALGDSVAKCMGPLRFHDRHEFIQQLQQLV